MPNIIRVTLFKIPERENIEKMFDLYRTLSTTALKDGKPYILSLHAGPTFDDARNQGFTLAAKSEYASVEDMKYYDTECEAHKVLKAAAQGLGIQGMMMVYYSPEVVKVNNIV